MGENFSFCISSYLRNRYNYHFSEELVFVLGSCHSLSLLSRESGHVIKFSNKTLAAKSTFISGTTTMALQNFSTAVNSVLRIEQRKGDRDLKWIIQDYNNLGQVKTLTTFPRTVLNENKTNSTQLIYTLAYPNGQSTNSTLGTTFKNSKIVLELVEDLSIVLTGSEFLNYWEDNSISRTFGTNRFVIIPPTFHDFSSTIKMMIKNSLLRTFLNLARESNEVGPNLFLRLINDLDSNESSNNTTLHRNLLVDSIEINNISGQYSMSRDYAAICFERLGNEFNMEELIKFSICLKKSGLVWKNAYSELTGNAIVSRNLTREIYLELYVAEKNILNKLKSIIKQ